MIAGCALGLIPQIIFDLTHRFAQLGGFFVWLLYRFFSFFAVGRSHAVSSSLIGNAWNIFIHYFSQIFSLEIKPIGIVMFLVLLTLIVLVWMRSQKNLFQQSIIVSLILLLMALFVHGTPSEAYFPPVILLSCMVIGTGLSFLPMPLKIFGIGAVVILSIVNTWEIYHHNFFTQPTNSTFQYGPSYKEQLQVMKFVSQSASGQPYELRSTDTESQFETYLDNYRVIGLMLSSDVRKNDQNTSMKKIYFINKKKSELVTYPAAKITFFPDVDVIEIPMNYE